MAAKDKDDSGLEMSQASIKSEDQASGSESVRMAVRNRGCGRTCQFQLLYDEALCQVDSLQRQVRRLRQETLILQEENDHLAQQVAAQKQSSQADKLAEKLAAKDDIIAKLTEELSNVKSQLDAERSTPKPHQYSYSSPEMDSEKEVGESYTSDTESTCSSSSSIQELESEPQKIRQKSASDSATNTDLETTLIDNSASECGPSIRSSLADGLTRTGTEDQPITEENVQVLKNNTSNPRIMANSDVVKSTETGHIEEESHTPTKPELVSSKLQPASPSRPKPDPIVQDSTCSVQARQPVCPTVENNVSDTCTSHACQHETLPALVKDSVTDKPEETQETTEKDCNIEQNTTRAISDNHACLRQNAINGLSSENSNARLDCDNLPVSGDIDTDLSDIKLRSPSLTTDSKCVPLNAAEVNQDQCQSDTDFKESAAEDDQGSLSNGIATDDLSLESSSQFVVIDEATMDQEISEPLCQSNIIDHELRPVDSSAEDSKNSGSDIYADLFGGDSFSPIKKRPFKEHVSPKQVTSQSEVHSNMTKAPSQDCSLEISGTGKALRKSNQELSTHKNNEAPKQATHARAKRKNMSPSQFDDNTESKRRKYGTDHQQITEGNLRSRGSDDRSNRSQKASDRSSLHDERTNRSKSSKKERRDDWSSYYTSSRHTPCGDKNRHKRYDSECSEQSERCYDSEMLKLREFDQTKANKGRHNQCSRADSECSSDVARRQDGRTAQKKRSISEDSHHGRRHVRADHGVSHSEKKTSHSDRPKDKRRTNSSRGNDSYSGKPPRTSTPQTEDSSKEDVSVKAGNRGVHGYQKSLPSDQREHATSNSSNKAGKTGSQLRDDKMNKVPKAELNKKKSSHRGMSDKQRLKAYLGLAAEKEKSKHIIAKSSSNASNLVKKDAVGRLEKCKLESGQSFAPNSVSTSISGMNHVDNYAIRPLSSEAVKIDSTLVDLFQSDVSFVRAIPEETNKDENAAVPQCTGDNGRKEDTIFVCQGASDTETKGGKYFTEFVRESHEDAIDDSPDPLKIVEDMAVRSPIDGEEKHTSQIIVDEGSPANVNNIPIKANDSDTLTISGGKTSDISNVQKAEFKNVTDCSSPCDKNDGLNLQTLMADQKNASVSKANPAINHTEKEHTMEMESSCIAESVQMKPNLQTECHLLPKLEACSTTDSHVEGYGIAEEPTTKNVEPNIPVDTAKPSGLEYYQTRPKPVVDPHEGQGYVEIAVPQPLPVASYRTKQNRGIPPNNPSISSTYSTQVVGSLNVEYDPLNPSMDSGRLPCASPSVCYGPVEISSQLAYRPGFHQMRPPHRGHMMPNHHHHHFPGGRPRHIRPEMMHGGPGQRQPWQHGANGNHLTPDSNVYASSKLFPGDRRQMNVEPQRFPVSNANKSGYVGEKASHPVPMNLQTIQNKDSIQYRDPRRRKMNVDTPPNLFRSSTFPTSNVSMHTSQVDPVYTVTQGLPHTSSENKPLMPTCPITVSDSILKSVQNALNTIKSASVKKPVDDILQKPSKPTATTPKDSLQEPIAVSGTATRPPKDVMSKKDFELRMKASLEHLHADPLPSALDLFQKSSEVKTCHGDKPGKQGAYIIKNASNIKESAVAHVRYSMKNIQKVVDEPTGVNKVNEVASKEIVDKRRKRRRTDSQSRSEVGAEKKKKATPSNCSAIIDTSKTKSDLGKPVREPSAEQFAEVMSQESDCMVELARSTPLMDSSIMETSVAEVGCSVSTSASEEQTPLSKAGTPSTEEMGEDEKEGSGALMVVGNLPAEKSIHSQPECEQAKGVTVHKAKENTDVELAECVNLFKRNHAVSRPTEISDEHSAKHSNSGGSKLKPSDEVLTRSHKQLDPHAKSTSNHVATSEPTSSETDNTNNLNADVASDEGVKEIPRRKPYICPDVEDITGNSVFLPSTNETNMQTEAESSRSFGLIGALAFVRSDNSSNIKTETNEYCNPPSSGSSFLIEHGNIKTEDADDASDVKNDNCKMSNNLQFEIPCISQQYAQKSVTENDPKISITRSPTCSLPGSSPTEPVVKQKAEIDPPTSVGSRSASFDPERNVPELQEGGAIEDCNYVPNISSSSAENESFVEESMSSEVDKRSVDIESPSVCTDESIVEDAKDDTLDESCTDGPDIEHDEPHNSTNKCSAEVSKCVLSDRSSDMGRKGNEGAMVCNDDGYPEHRYKDDGVKPYNENEGESKLGVSRTSVPHCEETMLSVSDATPGIMDAEMVAPVTNYRSILELDLEVSNTEFMLEDTMETTTSDRGEMSEGVNFKGCFSSRAEARSRNSSPEEGEVPPDVTPCKGGYKNDAPGSDYRKMHRGDGSSRKSDRGGQSRTIDGKTSPHRDGSKSRPRERECFRTVEREDRKVTSKQHTSKRNTKDDSSRRHSGTRAEHHDPNLKGAGDGPKKKSSSRERQQKRSEAVPLRRSPRKRATVTTEKNRQSVRRRPNYERQ